jgi:hypothetical protein
MADGRPGIDLGTEVQVIHLVTEIARCGTIYNQVVFWSATSDRENPYPRVSRIDSWTLTIAAWLWRRRKSIHLSI